MLSTLIKTWQKISYIGIDQIDEQNYVGQKKRIFFNRSMVLGFIAIFWLHLLHFPIIGVYTFINLIGLGAIILGFWLNKKGKYSLAKLIVVYSIFVMSIILTGICGGSFLYHTGSITLLTFAWVLFDQRKDRIHLFVFVLFTLLTYIIGEFNFFDAAEIENPTFNSFFRITNLIMFTFLVIVFLNFVLRLNRQFEAELSFNIEDKQLILSELTDKTKELERERLELETIIELRTTELRDQKNELIEQNSEKEVLLKEIHHRVKNNLQIIVSLLNLQAANFEDEKLLNSIQETQNRIIAMSLVHQRMYQTTNFVAIEFRDYISSLFENNRLFYNAQKFDLHFENSTSPQLKIDIETSIPLGLIINELITNAFKHAFVDSTFKYHLKIEISESSANNYSFLYQDNGPGFPEGLWMESKTMGLQLVQALVEQINGVLLIDSSDGLKVSFDFKS